MLAARHASLQTTEERFLPSVQLGLGMVRIAKM